MPECVSTVCLMSLFALLFLAIFLPITPSLGPYVSALSLVSLTSLSTLFLLILHGRQALSSFVTTSFNCCFMSILYIIPVVYYDP